MKQKTFKKPTYIKHQVNQKQLTEITIETGNKNVYLPDENKFIVTEGLLFNVAQLLSNTNLVKVDLSNLNFTNMSSMAYWFTHCQNLTEVIFPKEDQQCYNLMNLTSCFLDTNIKELNLSKLHIKVPVLMANLATSSKKLKKVILPKSTQGIKSMDFFMSDCVNLNEIDFNESIFCRKLSDFKPFDNCPNLKYINANKMTQTNFLRYTNQIPEKCVVLVKG